MKQKEEIETQPSSSDDLARGHKPDQLPAVFYRRSSLIFECVVVCGVAAFLRFFLIDRTEFDSDQAILFRMAYDAVHQGLVPVTSNVASIGIPHPPGTIYLFMIPALLSADPLGGALLVSFFSTAAVLLTYLFTSRYFGRGTGLIAALLSATATVPLNYARFIWQPNLMPPFVVLYLFALFRGVHDRRPGWVMFALPLLGILFQMHPTGGLLAVLFLVALFLAPNTVRWYDWAVALVFLVIIFSPYMLYSALTGFADWQTFILLAKQPAHIDLQALRFYRLFLSPFGSVPNHPDALLRQIAPGVSWLSVALPLLVVAGAIVVCGSIFRTNAQAFASTTPRSSRVLKRLVGAWQALRADPVRCGMVLLLIWQVIPLLALSRHQIDLHAQYLFILLPGPFILVALFLTWALRWARVRWSLAPIGVSALVLVLILTQLVSSMALVLDTSYGNFSDASFFPYHNSLYSIRQALAKTEQVAEEQHIEHIYITSDRASDDALSFLVPQMKHSATLFETPGCFVLPPPSAGPALVLTSPYNAWAETLLQRFTAVKQKVEIPRIGGDPYILYAVISRPFSSSGQEAFPHQLSLLDSHPETLMSADGKSWLVSRWQMQQTEPQAFRTHYSYIMKAAIGEKQIQNTCSLNSIQAGDQLFLAWAHPESSKPTAFQIQGTFAVTTPSFLRAGPLRLDMYRSRTHEQPLIATDQQRKGVTLYLS